MAAKLKKTSDVRGQTKSVLTGSASSTRRFYRLKILLIMGMVAEEFEKSNPVVSRTIVIRGDQTLEDLHDVIFKSHDRHDHHMYEFQFGKKPMDRKGARYVMPMIFQDAFDDGGDPAAGSVDQTTIDSLMLNVRQSFFYWFDFGDDWWHQIEVEAIEESGPAGKYPKVVEKVGKSPPQYMEEDEE